MKSQRSCGTSTRKAQRGGGLSSSVYRSHGLSMGMGDVYDSDYDSKLKTVHTNYPKFQDITNDLFKVDDKTAHLLAQVSDK